VSIDAFQQALLQAFLGKHLLAVQDDLEKDLEAKLEEQGKQTEIAKTAISKIIGWVADPASIEKDVLAIPGAAAGAILDSAIDSWAKNRADDLRKQYEDQLNLLENLQNGDFTSESPWQRISVAADELAKKYREGVTPSAVYTQADAGDSKVRYYNGDPANYITGQSEYVGGGQVITDDFREYGASGEVTGVLDPSAMNHLQRKAYDAWLHDPAIQAELARTQTTLEEALRRANVEIKGK
jgi:hypothetical protein